MDGFSVSPYVIFFLMLTGVAYGISFLVNNPMSVDDASHHARVVAQVDGVTSGAAALDSMINQAMASNAPIREAEVVLPLDKISGEANVLPDASLQILGVKIRLEGLVLPPTKDAIEMLNGFASAGDIHCSLQAGKTETRTGTCWVMSAGHPIDILAELILAGVARECVKETRGRYFPFEQMPARELPVPLDCADEAPAPSLVVAQ